MSAPAIAARPRPRAASGALLAAALADLCDDFSELLALCGSGETELRDAAIELGAASPHERTRELLTRQLASSRHRYRSAAERLISLREQAERSAPTHSVIEELAAAKSSFADLLRTEQALTAALVGAADWQSPSFLHSLAPAVGRQNGRVRAHWDDYKRDRHLDADGYERRYIEAMVDGPPGLRALLTSCGMAAFTTILSFLSMEAKLDGSVLAGAGLYHESKLLLEQALPRRVYFVDERDTRALVRAIVDLRPSAISSTRSRTRSGCPSPTSSA